MAQEKAISLATNGHSFLMTGSCGTGKTYTLRKIIQTLTNLKSVAVTATTGMASMQIGMKASTVHHWSGILDGRYSHEKLMDLYNNDDKFASAKQRVACCECLIIDEISMLSRKTFETLEFVCRHVKQNNLCFGGIQVIGSGDFKQLPPVPNRYLNDDGEYCFRSPIFDIAFPHHIQLLKVIRQKEKDLALAVQELCDGTPSSDTIHLLRSLQRPLDIADDRITRLYGTNFDVRFINEVMIDNLEGNTFVFKSNDQGNKKLLLGMAVPKTLILKEQAPVILLKNIGCNLVNGQKGVVAKLVDDGQPIINFNGTLHKLKQEKFEIFDSSTNKILASRTQYPLVLGYAMTVHRAQGQTLNYVEVDCSSYFAPGQLGVAVGRAVSKNGLRILNFNIEAANLKHPDYVYDFHNRAFTTLNDDMSCCKKDIQAYIEFQQQNIVGTHVLQPNEQYSDCDENNNVKYLEEEFPGSSCLFDITDFMSKNETADFISLLSPEVIASDRFKDHFSFLNSKVDACLSDETDTKQKWMLTYKSLNYFLVSKKHINAIKKLFETEIIYKNQNKLSSKLSFWLLEKKISCKTDAILANQMQSSDRTQQSGKSVSCMEEISEAGRAKIRYLAGVCINKIKTRVRESVERKIGTTIQKSKMVRQFNYFKDKLIRKLRVTEDAIGMDNPSMAEINSKQNKNRGLTIVNEELFIFFIKLNDLLQSLLSKQKMHLNLENIHNICRTYVDKDNNLLSEWISLFTSDDDTNYEDELFLDLVAELFKDVTEHFLRLAIIDALRQFKSCIPRKKKQALRTKITALGDRNINSKTKNSDSISSDIYVCDLCNNVCEEEPLVIGKSSIGCDQCNKWFHYRCVGVKGTESFLKRKNSSWFCSSCSKKGKGRGKKSKN